MIKLKKPLGQEATSATPSTEKSDVPPKTRPLRGIRPAAQPAEVPAAPSQAGKENQPWNLPAPKVGNLPAKTPRPPLKKPKLVRDSFVFPERDYALLDVLKEQAAMAGREVKKSELLRAGLAALIAMSNKNLIKVLDKVERIKTPGKAKAGRKSK